MAEVAQPMALEEQALLVKLVLEVLVAPTPLILWEELAVLVAKEELLLEHWYPLHLPSPPYLY